MCQTRKPRVPDYRCDYATHADFCNALVDNTDTLYLLAFLLMTNHTDAEVCFLAMVELAFRPNTVFKEWLAPWIKRTLITCAIDNTNFSTTPAGQREPDPWSTSQTETGSVIDAIARLAVLDRFVFVMSVLERYSAHECSLLLGFPLAVIIESRACGLRDLRALNTTLVMPTLRRTSALVTEWSQ